MRSRARVLALVSLSGVATGMGGWMQARCGDIVLAVVSSRDHDRHGEASWMRQMLKAPGVSIAACGMALVFTFMARHAAEAASCPNAGYVVVEPNASPDTRPVKAGPGHTIFVRRAPITTTADLAEMKLAGDADESQIQMKFTPDAARRLHDATTNKSGLRIAFVSDEQAISVVNWTGPYGMDANLGVQINLQAPISEMAPLIAAIQKCVASNGR